MLDDDPEQQGLTAAAGLSRIAAVLAEHLGIREQVTATIGDGERLPDAAPDEAAVGGATMAVSQAAGQHRPSTVAWDADPSQPTTDWLVTKLGDHGVDELAVLAAGGDEHLRLAWMWLLADMVATIVARGAEPVARAVAAVVGEHANNGGVVHKPVGQVVDELTRPTVTHLTDTLLQPLGVIASQAREAALNAYAGHGPFQVDLAVPLPVALPGRARRAWPTSDDTPLGVTEIAEIVAVQPNTVEAWRRRHDPDAPHPFPEVTWPVGGRPAWRWGDIRTWLERTGRLDGAKS